ncbi:DUF402 domain-containing protein [Candidatus Uabimicrobium sp. HlEnr_7]|uniref:DUF402 domain-containing protein n=1 Tax=Candidatus Uabimicrobium helgolandensis TaxID=3095367 RepID=UPI0035579EED
MDNSLTIHKCDHQGNDVFRYQAQCIHSNKQRMIVQASFVSHKDYDIFGLQLKNGDKCIEAFYFEKWYNIFEIYDGESNDIRGWYCNITKPIVIKDSHLYYYDLALDIIAFPNGRKIVVDEDEFIELSLTKEVRFKAQEALKELHILLEKEIPLCYSSKE